MYTPVNPSFTVKQRGMGGLTLLGCFPDVQVMQSSVASGKLDFIVLEK